MVKVLQHPQFYAHEYRALHRGNYTLGRGGYSVNKVVVHIMQGSFDGSISWGQQNRSNVSWHYAVARNGHTAQCVSENNTCWTNSNWAWNASSVTLEHAGYASQGGPSEAQLHASAKLVAGICHRHDIPIDRNHIFGHYQVPGSGKPCPGPWPWARYMALVKQYRFGNAPTPKPAPSQPASKPVASKKANYARINFLGYGKKDREIVYAGRAALNAIARDRDMSEMFAYGTTDPGEIAYISGRSAIAKKNQVVSVVCGAPAKRYLAPEVKVIGTLDKTDVLDGCGEDYEHSKQLVSWRLDAISEMLGFGQSEQDKVQSIYAEAVGLKA